MSFRATLRDRVRGAVLPLLLLAAAACSSGGGGSGDVIPPPPPGVQPTIGSIQNNIFTPKCALSGCHTGPTPQPLQGAGLDLSLGMAQDSLLGADRKGVPSTIDPNFMRVVQGNPADSYLYMKVTGDPRIDVALTVGICETTTGTTCAVDADCPPGEACTLRGQQMPRRGPPLTAQERAAIYNWILNRQVGDPGPPGY